MIEYLHETAKAAPWKKPSQIPTPPVLNSTQPSARPPPLHTATSILIRATREQIFEVVRDLARWPERLPHYRFIRFLGKDPGGRELVQMSARRGPLPVTWRSAYEADPATLELRFEHLRAWTKGMLVVWTLTPTRDGTRVEIVHDLKFRVPALAWFAEPIITGFFIEPIARKTLATFKQLIEGGTEVVEPRRMPDAER